MKHLLTFLISGAIVFTSCKNKEIIVPPKSIALNKTTLTLAIGKEEKLTVAISPSTASKELTWSSADATIATVSQEGMVKAIELGKTTITAVTTNNIKATCEVTVSEIRETVELTLNKRTLTLLKGKEEKLTLTNPTNKEVEWRSSDAKVATVSQDGMVKAVDSGKTVIIVETKDKTAKVECAVTVSETGGTTPKPKPGSIALNKTTLTLLEGSEEKLTLTNPSGKQVMWNSSDATIAIVTDGTVKALKSGKTTITVKIDDNTSATCVLTVIPDVIPDPSSMLQFCESTIWNGETMYIANFGNSGSNPVGDNSEGKGYIKKYENGVLSDFIPADGKLNAPKGMAIQGDKLFIADVEKILVYKISAPTAAPETIPFPSGETMVNGLAINGTALYASVTNTGNIFKIDYPNPTPKQWSNVSGANGIVFVDNTLYVASYYTGGGDGDGIYVISDLNAPNPTKFIDRVAPYDGLVVSEDKKTLYYTTATPEIGKIDIASKTLTPISSKHTITEPAALSLKNGYLFVPDLSGSKVYVIKP